MTDFVVFVVCVSHRLVSSPRPQDHSHRICPSAVYRQRHTTSRNAQSR